MATTTDQRREGEEKGFSTTDLLPFADGVAPSTLNSWVARELVAPSLLASTGRQRATRYWSVEDAVIVRAIYRLRRWRAPDIVLRLTGQRIRESNRGGTLRWDGKHFVDLIDDLEVDVNVVPGQIQFSSEVFHLATIPLHGWFQEAERQAKWYNIRLLAERRMASAKKRGLVDEHDEISLEDEHLRQDPPDASNAGDTEADR